MIKKLLVLAIVGGAVVFVVGKSRVGSYIRSEIKALREAAEDQVPPEKEIELLRDEVSRIDTDIKKVVKEQVAREQERDELVARKALLTKNLPGMRDRLQGMADKVRSAESRSATETDVTVQFAPEEKPVNVGEAKVRLAAEVQKVSAAEKELGHLTTKIESLNRIIKKLDDQKVAMQRAKDELNTAVDELEDELLDLKVQQLESKYSTDDTRVTKIKERTAKLKKRLDLQKRELAKLQGVEAGVAAKSVDEIMAPVNNPSAKPVGAVSENNAPATMPYANN